MNGFIDTKVQIVSKQLNFVQSGMVKAATKFEPLSVVAHIRLAESSSKFP